MKKNAQEKAAEIAYGNAEDLNELLCNAENRSDAQDVFGFSERLCATDAKSRVLAIGAHLVYPEFAQLKKRIEG